MLSVTSTNVLFLPLSLSLDLLWLLPLHFIKHFTGQLYLHEDISHADRLELTNFTHCNPANFQQILY